MTAVVMDARKNSADKRVLQTVDGKTIEIPTEKALQKLTEQFHSHVDTAVQNDTIELNKGLTKAELWKGCGGLNRQQGQAALEYRISRVRMLIDEIAQVSTASFEPLAGYVPEVVDKSIGWRDVNSELQATEEKVQTLGLADWTGAGGDAYRKQKQAQLDDITTQRQLSAHNSKALDSVALLQAMLLVAFDEQLNDCERELRTVAASQPTTFKWKRQAKTHKYFGRLAQVYCILFDYSSRLTSLDSGQLFAPVDACQKQLSSELETAAKDAMHNTEVKEAGYAGAKKTKVESGTDQTWKAEADVDLANAQRIQRDRTWLRLFF